MVAIGDNLRNPYKFDIPDNGNILNHIVNDFISDLEMTTFPPVITKRVWGIEFEYRGEKLYDIWEEYAIGHIGMFQRYHKNEYLVRRWKRNDNF
jgi:hypothetical protein